MDAKGVITWTAALLMIGCGSTGVETAESMATAGGELIAEALPDYPYATPDDSLAEAPWMAAALNATAAPAELVSAWQAAQNRDWCAPIVPASVEGARARRSDFDGGWAVEFEGARGSFGVAGTAVLVDEQDPTEAERVIWRDGSHMRLEAADEEDAEAGPVGHVASLRIRGQDCLYQVWSFVDDEHLQQLVDDLRFVDSE